VAIITNRGHNQAYSLSFLDLILIKDVKVYNHSRLKRGTIFIQKRSLQSGPRYF